MLYRPILQLACFALCLVTPALATAAPRPWLSGWFGGSAYAMGDVNDDIGEINSFLEGSGLKMEEIHRGPTYGLALGLDVGSGFSVGFGYERLTGKGDVSHPAFSLGYDLPATLLRGFGRYSFESTGKTKAFLELSIGNVTCDGIVTATISGVGTETTSFEGTDPALEGAAGFSYWTKPQVALVGVFGYRSANVEGVEANGVPAYDPRGEPYSIDYSGAFVRLGLTFALAP